MHPKGWAIAALLGLVWSPAAVITYVPCHPSAGCHGNTTVSPVLSD